MTCLSMPHSSHAVHWVAGHLRVRLPATPPTFHRPNGGGQPWPCAFAQGPTKNKEHPAFVVEHDGHVNDQVQETDCNCGISTVSHNCTRTAGPAQPTTTTLSLFCKWRISGRRTMGICLCATTGLSIATSRCGPQGPSPLHGETP